MLKNNGRKYMLNLMNLIGEAAYDCLKNKDKIKSNMHFRKQI